MGFSMNRHIVTNHHDDEIGWCEHRMRGGDETPIYRHWEPGKYNSECSCCWLGFSHSEAVHAEALNSVGR